MGDEGEGETWMELELEKRRRESEGENEWKSELVYEGGENEMLKDTEVQARYKSVDVSVRKIA